MNQITEAQFFGMVNAMIAGVSSNPACGNLAMDSYGIQQLTSTVIQNVGQGLANAGIQIIPDND